MANVITHHPHYGFPSNPMHHKPPALGFGFGMSSSPSMSSRSSPSSVTPPTQWPLSTLAPPHQSQTRSSKRRLETDEDSDEHGRSAKDVSMDRSPTPERPKRAVPKRMRTTPVVITVAKEGKEEQKSGDEAHDVDVGVLLASLPQQSLLPLLSALITSQPSLKSSVLSLIPRPTLTTATESIASASRKLLNAYPYSNGSTVPTSFGFGSARAGPPTTSFGFGTTQVSGSASFGDSPHGSGMRDEYIVSRIRPHIADFVSACNAYFPYFSYVTTSTLSMGVSASHSSQSDASTLQSLHKDKSHPSETFLFLQTVMNHVLSQPPLTRTELLPAILPRLTEEWKGWISRVDEVVNKEGGMFGQEAVRGWERGLDEFAHAKGDGLEVMREIRDQWVLKVGWLVGRQAMEEEL